MTANKVKQALKSPQGTRALESLYGRASTAGAPGPVERQRSRYVALVDRFESTFPNASGLGLFSAPGRTEICGNHTDHNGGRVLAAAVAHDAVAVAAPTSDRIITIESEGYPRQSVDLDDLARHESERSAAIALTRGVAARFKALGFMVGGFSACVTSDVLKGSGLSSSAAYEVLVGTILNQLFNRGAVDALQIALIGQYAENEYFGKPCGLMDQTTSAVGGFVSIDFKDFAHPVVRAVSCDFAGSGYIPAIVDTGGSHADLTDDYAAVKLEMKDVARCLGGSVLRDVTREGMLAELPRIREQAGDRAVLRALHFFADDERVAQQVEALEAGRFGEFLNLVRESGRSSWMLLQNCYSTRALREQGVPLALALSERVLGDTGAWRVHGGGFAGTILAFLPQEKLEKYVETMRSAFGRSSCHVLSIRPQGALMLPLG
ncbi:MAG TPA: galactokinase family protein [Spirochaetia bacterium]|nr:galactokinase family protein [Spirochaetia bacterium]